MLKKVDSKPKNIVRNDEKQNNGYRKNKGITLVALVITIVLNCCRSGRNHIKETNLKNILEKRINLL